MPCSIILILAVAFTSVTTNIQSSQPAASQSVVSDMPKEGSLDLCGDNCDNVKALIACLKGEVCDQQCKDNLKKLLKLEKGVCSTGEICDKTCKNSFEIILRNIDNAKVLVDCWKKQSCETTHSHIEEILKKQLPNYTTQLSDLKKSWKILKDNNIGNDDEIKGRIDKHRNILWEVEGILHENARDCRCLEREIDEDSDDYAAQLVKLIQDIEANLLCLNEKENEKSEKTEQNRERKKCQIMLDNYKKKLANRRNSILEEITGLQKKVVSPGSTKEERNKDLDKITENQKTLQKMEGTIAFSKNDEPLFIDFQDYERYFFKLTAGFEYISVNEIFEKGYPRLGLLVYRKYGPRKAVKYGWRYKEYGFHFFGEARLSNSGERVVTGGTTEPSSEKTLEGELSLFWPIARSYINDQLSGYWGLIMTGGAMIDDNPDAGLDDDSHVAGRYYVGIRSAINPELFLDLLYGRTKTLDSERVEVRGQLPVFRFANGSRLFLGVIGNFGITKERKSENNSAGIDEKDVVRVYVSWHINFLDIFNKK